MPAGTAITVTPVSHKYCGSHPNLIKDGSLQGTIFPATGPVPLTTASASAIILQPTFDVQPGQSHTSIVLFTLPRGDATTFPVYSGFIQVTSGSENLHVSYIGLGASLKNKQVIDNTDVFFGVKLPLLLDSVGDVQTQPKNYTFVGQDFPTLVFRFVVQICPFDFLSLNETYSLVFGTPTFRVDLVDPNIQLAGTLSKRGLFS